MHSSLTKISRVVYFYPESEWMETYGGKPKKNKTNLNSTNNIFIINKIITLGPTFLIL